MALCGCDDESPLDGGVGVDGGTSDGGGRDGAIDSGRGTDSGTDAGFDAAPFMPECASAMIRIEETCPAFTPCGGDVVGNWCYADICIKKNDLLNTILARPELPASLMDCTADLIEIRASEGTITRGAFNLDGAGSFTRMVTTTSTGTFVLPQECVAHNCLFMEALLNGALDPLNMRTEPPVSCMADEGAPPRGPCVCDVTFETSADETGTFTVDATTNTLSLDTGAAGGPRSYDYCVGTDGAFRFEETTPGATLIEPGTQWVNPI